MSFAPGKAVANFSRDLIEQPDKLVTHMNGQNHGYNYGLHSHMNGQNHWLQLWVAFTHEWLESWLQLWVAFTLDVKVSVKEFNPNKLTKKTKHTCFIK